MNYATARARAEKMAAGARDAACIIVDADGEWEPMWFGEWMGSSIPHVRIGWVSSNSQAANETNFATAVGWLEEQARDG